MKKIISRPTIIKYIIIWILAIILVAIPFWIILVNSFKGLAEANKLGLGLPTEWNIIENYKVVIFEGNLASTLINSLLITGISVLGIILLGSMAAWGFARSKSKIISFLYFLTISGLFLSSTIISTIKLLKLLHIYGSYTGLIFVNIGIFMALNVFLMTGFIKSIPIELEEAARIDGCSAGTIFFRIILPLMKPVIATSSIILTLIIWNDFIHPFYYLRDSKAWTLNLGLFAFANKYQDFTCWNLVFADVILVSSPLLIFYIIAQKRIVAGVMGGSIK